MNITTIIFDLGGVLIDWNPRYVFSDIFEDKEEMEWFLKHVCSNEWNQQMDKGYAFAAGVAGLQARFPEFHQHIAAYHHRWKDMLKGEIPGTVKILQELQTKKYHVYGLTNWSHETFPVAQSLYAFLGTFDGIVVSGVEKLVKPDPALFNVLIQRYNIVPSESVYIDDNTDNVITAASLGFVSLHFTSPEKLRSDLQGLQVII